MRRSRLSVAIAISAIGLLSGVLALTTASPASAAATKGIYNPLPKPQRIMDTRLDGFGVHPCVAPGGQEIQVTGAIPHTSDSGSDFTTSEVVPVGAASVVLNVTVVNPNAAGWLTVWSGSGATPTASSLNFVSGDIVPNSVIARLNQDEGKVGKIKMVAPFGCPDVVIDVVGWFSKAPLDDANVDPALRRPDPGGFRASTSATPRIMDTRPQEAPTVNDGCLAPTATKDLDVTNEGGIPASGVKAVALNVTVVNPTSTGWLTVYPTPINPAEGPQQGTSNLNFKANQVVPNMVVVKLGNADKIRFAATGGGCPNIVVDVIGWFQDGAQDVQTFEGLTPKRLMDTRPGMPAEAGNPGPPCVSSERKLQVAGRGGVPGLDAAKPPLAVALNVTAVNASTGAEGFVTVWPSTETKPYTSNLNYRGGPGAVPNMVITKVGEDGKVSFFASEGCPDIVVDVVGWWAAADPALTSASPQTFALDTNGQVNVEKDLTVTNNSNFDDPSKPVFTFTGAQASQFSAVSNTCPTGTSGLPNSGGAAQSCTVKVRWQPTAGATAITDTDAQLVITSGLGVTTVELNGTRPAAAP